MKDLGKTSYVVPVLVGKNQLFDMDGINLEFLHIFEKKDSISARIKKKGFAVSFDKDCKPPQLAVKPGLAALS